MLLGDLIEMGSREMPVVDIGMAGVYNNTHYHYHYHSREKDDKGD